MENEQVETMMGPQLLTAGQGLRTSDSTRKLLSSIGLFIGMGVLGFWFGIGATLGAKMGPYWGPGSLGASPQVPMGPLWDPMVNSLEELIS